MSCHFHLMRRRARAEAARKAEEAMRQAAEAAESAKDVQDDKQDGAEQEIAGKATKSRRKDDA